jgi:hypothetical protein
MYGFRPAFILARFVVNAKNEEGAIIVGHHSGVRQRRYVLAKFMRISVVDLECQQPLIFMGFLNEPVQKGSWI